ncbi:MAG: hypothetical protein JW940_00210 [Polyangiaceae bacterium]|nr:hypothetical protein [Polyangiaceae bacterium]
MMTSAAWLMLTAPACAGRPVQAPPAAPVVRTPPAAPVAHLDEVDAEESLSPPDPPQEQNDDEAPLPPRRDATEADGSPRPFVPGELTPPSGYGILGIGLTVLAAPPKVVGGFEPSYPPAGDSPAGVLVSPRWYRPLAWEQLHGSFDGYVPGPDASDPDPSFTFSGRVVREPMELLVFGADAHWTETVPLVPCTTNRCPKYVSPPDSVVVVVSAGTAERLGVGKGWSIAIGG